VDPFSSALVAATKAYFKMQLNFGEEKQKGKSRNLTTTELIALFASFSPSE
jgi:hypothetical protein